MNTSQKWIVILSTIKVVRKFQFIFDVSSWNIQVVNNTQKKKKKIPKPSTTQFYIILLYWPNTARKIAASKYAVLYIVAMVLLLVPKMCVNCRRGYRLSFAKSQSVVHCMYYHGIHNLRCALLRVFVIHIWIYVTLSCCLAYWRLWLFVFVVCVSVAVLTVWLTY